MRPPLPEYFWLACVIAGISGALISTAIMWYFTKIDRWHERHPRG